MYMSPSFAGSMNGTRFVTVFRDQWPKIPGTYVSYSFSVDQYVSKFRSGLGIYAVSDNAGNGKLVTTNVAFNYSYKVKLTRNLFFQPGLAAYYYSRKVDYSSLDFADEYFGGHYVGSTSEVLPISKVQHADFAVSSLFYSNQFWVGVNVDHLMNLSPVLQSDLRYADMRLAVYGGYKFPIRRRTRNNRDEFVHLAFNYWLQSSIHQLDIGAYYNRFPLILGVWYRGIPLLNEYTTSDALIFLAGLRYKDYVFSYSYDMTIGPLISQTGGSHEIAISYSIVSGSRPKKFKPIPCPEW